MSYNGWSNWETWNVALWVDNDETMYRARSHRRMTAQQVCVFVQGLMPGGTPDFESEGGAACYGKVEWDEIAENWNSELDNDSDDAPAKPVEPPSDYEARAASFLERNGLKCRATFKGDRCPPFCEGKHIHGNRYRVTVSRKGKGRLSFDFWNSLNDSQNGKTPSAYDVLACISSDAHCPDTFEDFCGEYGYETDSRKALDTFKRCSTFARRMQGFFTAEELEQLGEIQ